MRQVNFIRTASGTMTLLFGGRSHTVDKGHPNYSKILEAVKADDVQGLEKLVDIPQALNSFSAGKVTVQNGQVYYGAEEVHGSISQRILELLKEDLPFEPVARFYERLQHNPSHQSVKELYDFLEKRALPITEDGCFLAYKRVKDDWTDFHTGKVLNKIGTVVEMPRNKVDDDRAQGCSYGYHVGAIEYVSSFNSGGHILICKVDPADVVSVPLDAGCTKLRTCKYEIVGEYQGDLEAPLYQASAQTGYRVYDDHEADLDDDYDPEDEENYGPDTSYAAWQVEVSEGFTDLGYSDWVEKVLYEPGGGDTVSLPPFRWRMV